MKINIESYRNEDGKILLEDYGNPTWSRSLGEAVTKNSKSHVFYIRWDTNEDSYVKDFLFKLGFKFYSCKNWNEHDKSILKICTVGPYNVAHYFDIPKGAYIVQDLGKGRYILILTEAEFNEHYEVIND